MKLGELFEEAERKDLVGFATNNQTADPKKEWSGAFRCNNFGITSLKGAPLSVQDEFFAGTNKLTTLKYGPVRTGGFYCHTNMLTSLKFCPTECDGPFSCSENKITSLEFAPSSINGDFWCYSNNLTSLEYAPKLVHGNFWCGQNQLTSLHNIHKIVEVIDGKFSAFNNPIKSHVLGLLKIKKLDFVELGSQYAPPGVNNTVAGIINKYVPLGSIIDCQQELIEAGFEEYAQL